MPLPFKQTEFYKSSFKKADLPPDNQIEFAFAGRSNVGKSSVINLLTQQKKLAKVSKTPGRTQAINFFLLQNPIFLVDLPGYGYAKVSQAMRESWAHFIQNYILERQSLRGIALIMDVRHPFTTLDQRFIELCKSRDLPCHILLNKADKLSNNEMFKTRQCLTNLVKEEDYAKITWQFFSAVDGRGLNDLQKILDAWTQ